MVTVVLAIALLVVGLALVFFQPQALDLARSLPLPRDLEAQVLSLLAEQVVAYLFLAGSPTLLIIGSLLPNI